MTKKIKKRRIINSRLLWLLSVLAAVVFMISFRSIPLFPNSWNLYVLILLVLLLGLTFMLSLKTKPQNIITKAVNLLLSIVLVIASVVLPYEVEKVSDIFNTVVGEKVTINVYRMKDSYISTHGFINVYDYEKDSDGKANIQSLKDAIFLTFLTVDNENQSYALSSMKKEFGKGATTIDKLSVVDAVAGLYRNEGDYLVMGSSYESVVEDHEEYEHFRDETEVIYSFTRTVEKKKTNGKKSALTNQPFTIFIGGNDTEGDLSLEGRTDVCMVISVNPKTHQISMINMPRDSYISNPYYADEKDKLTHLGIKGIDNTLKGLGTYLGVNIDYYGLVNFTTYMKIINSLGGVTVNNPYYFYYSYDHSADFPEGEITLKGWDALAYVRERYSLPDGDFGRSMHQQLVMKAIIRKITSAKGIVRFNRVLDAVKGNFLTNLTSDAIYGLVNKQLDENIKWNVVNYHVEGECLSKECASIPGQNLSVVEPYPNQVAFVKDVIQSLYKGEILEQKEMVEGTFEESE